MRWLVDLDPAYLRYRLAVIAVEDVAAGSPTLIARAFEDGWTKAAIARQGGDAFLIGQARAWAEAVKDRTPCAWLACAHFREPFEAAWGRWEMMTLGKARRLAFDAGQPWWVRGLAAWRAAGSDTLRGGMPSVAGDWESYVAAAAEQGLSEPLLACMRAGGKVQGEPHPIFLPLAAQAQAMESPSEAVRTIPQAGYAGPWLSAALDKHTSEGKRALGRLLQAQGSAVRGLMGQGATREAVEDLVGRLWFWMEGGLLDRHLDYPTARVIDQDTKRRHLEGARVSGRALFEAFRDVQAWHAAREAVVTPAASRGWAPR